MAACYYTNSVEMHDVIAEDYSKNMMSEENHLYAHKISKILPIQAGDIVLDVGAGNGRIAKAILEDYPLIEKYYALEPGKLADLFMFKDERVEIFRCLGQNVPLPDDVCNLVFASEVFCHLKKKQDQIDILREMSRVTKPGGFVCIINTLFFDNILYLYKRIRGIHEEYFKPQSKTEDDREVYLYRRGYSVYEIKNLLRKSNLKLVRLIPGWKKFRFCKVYLHIILQKISDARTR